MNCELNEYLSLAEDSATAVKAILERLKEIERTTGRPFVLMIYGDHQPHSFTGTKRWAADYSAVRRQVSQSQTFVHVMSSLPRSSKRIEREVPATLLPTILSTFVSNRSDELYMTVNIYLFEACESNLYGSLRPKGFFKMGKDKAIVATAKAREPNSEGSIAACGLAQQRTIGQLKKSLDLSAAGTLRPG
jgi:hypothetical protein